MSGSDWACCRRGDCCRQVAEVVMTTAEMAAVVAVRPGVGVFEGRPGGWWVLRARPCPFYADGCTVYAVRPYNCRRWGCFVEPGAPVTDFSAVPAHVLASADLVRQYARQQADAQTWAVAHGWTSEDESPVCDHGLPAEAGTAGAG